VRISIYLLLVLTGSHSAALSAAVQVYRCTANNGAVTFSDHGCPSASRQSTYQLATPIPLPALPPSTSQQRSSQQPRQHTRVTVIAEDTQPCGAFNPTERRTHLVRKQVTRGMSQAEIESMFGKPLTQRSHNGITQATYRSAKGHQRSVRFDQRGCVP
jgi:hypothetical protein